MSDDGTRDATIDALHRRIARLELENSRLQRQVDELRSAVAALLGPAPSELSQP
jgi:hypothetical protein